MYGISGRKIPSSAPWRINSTRTLVYRLEPEDLASDIVFQPYRHGVKLVCCFCRSADFDIQFKIILKHMLLKKAHPVIRGDVRAVQYPCGEDAGFSTTSPYRHAKT
jgi:hypothetical protein